MTPTTSERLEALAAKWLTDRHPDGHTDAWTLGYLRAKRECCGELRRASLPEPGVVSEEAVRAGLCEWFEDASGGGLGTASEDTDGWWTRMRAALQAALPHLTLPTAPEAAPAGEAPCRECGHGPDGAQHSRADRYMDARGMYHDYQPQPVPAEPKSWQERFAEKCNQLHVGQRVITSWGEGVVEAIDPDWHSGGVTVRHNKGAPRFSPGNVTPCAAPAAQGGEWVLVPKVATPAMLAAGVDAGVRASPEPWCPHAWAAMLSAAPSATAQQPVAVDRALLNDLDEWLQGCPDPDSVWPRWLVKKTSRLLWRCRAALRSEPQERQDNG